MTTEQIASIIFEIKSSEPTAVIEYLSKSDTLHYSWCFFHEVAGRIENSALVDHLNKMKENDKSLDIIPTNEHYTGLCITIHDPNKRDKIDVI